MKPGIQSCSEVKMAGSLIARFSFSAKHSKGVKRLSNAELEQRPTGNSTRNHKKTYAVGRLLQAVVRPLHCCAADQRKGTRPPAALYSPLAAGRVRPSTPVVPCARMLGWSREPAAPSVVTGDALIPFGRVLQSRRSRARCSAPPPPMVEMTMAPRKQKQARSKTTLPPQLAAANL